MAGKVADNHGPDDAASGNVGFGYPLAAVTRDALDQLDVRLGKLIALARVLQSKVEDRQDLRRRHLESVARFDPAHEVTRQLHLAVDERLVCLASVHLEREPELERVH